jgi:hypothetical protein
LYVNCLWLHAISCRRVMDQVFAYHILQLYNSLPWYAVCSGPFRSRSTIPNLTINSSLLFPWIWLHCWDILSLHKFENFHCRNLRIHIYLGVSCSWMLRDLIYLCWTSEHAGNYMALEIGDTVFAGTGCCIWWPTLSSLDLKDLLCIVAHLLWLNSFKIILEVLCMCHK